MGTYASGDVVLAFIRMAGGGDRKVRPAVVVATGSAGTLTVCPISSTASSDSSSVPLSLDDFACGGLDLFTESFALVMHTCTIRTTDVVGMKGRLTKDRLAVIAAGAGEALRKRDRQPRRRL
jgi:mRNA interferase MazF